MQEFFFVLGKNAPLSLSEIISWLNRLKIKYTLNSFSQEILLISTEADLTNNEIMKVLGGTVKFGKIFDRVDLEETEDKFNKIFAVENLKEKYFPSTKKKIHFGISIYNCGGEEKILEKLFGRIKELNLTVKRNLESQGVKAGFLLIKGDKLSSVSVAKNKLLGSEGAEIVLILTNKSIFIGKTIAVQEFAEFSFRDFGRPARDKKSGMIPPKLARIMLNLSQADKNGIILDPFCGSGTIIQEAIMLGYMNLIGSDISEKAIFSAKKNIEWLFNSFRKINKSSYNIRWWVSDVRLLKNKLANNSVDAVVTEPYLGPRLFKKPDKKSIQKILARLEGLYLEAFKNFKHILKPGGKIVIIFPVFTESGKSYFLEIIDDILKLGFTKENFMSFALSQRGTIIYGGSDYFLNREILIFKKGCRG